MLRPSAGRFGRGIRTPRVDDPHATHGRDYPARAKRGQELSTPLGGRLRTPRPRRQANAANGHGREPLSSSSHRCRGSGRIGHHPFPGVATPVWNGATSAEVCGGHCGGRCNPLAGVRISGEIILFLVLSRPAAFAGQEVSPEQGADSRHERPVAQRPPGLTDSTQRPVLTRLALVMPAVDCSIGNAHPMPQAASGPDHSTCFLAPCSRKKPAVLSCPQCKARSSGAQPAASLFTSAPAFARSSTVPTCPRMAAR